jgi:hypothetical protein
MKAVFTSEDPEEIRRLAKCTDMALALWEIDQLLSKEIEEEEGNAVFNLMDKINDVYISRGIVLHDIVT